MSRRRRRACRVGRQGNVAPARPHGLSRVGSEELPHSHPRAALAGMRDCSTSRTRKQSGTIVLVDKPWISRATSRVRSRAVRGYAKDERQGGPPFRGGGESERLQ